MSGTVFTRRFREEKICVINLYIDAGVNEGNMKRFLRALLKDQPEAIP